MRSRGYSGEGGAASPTAAAAGALTWFSRKKSSDSSSQHHERERFGGLRALAAKLGLPGGHGQSFEQEAKSLPQILRQSAAGPAHAAGSAGTATAAGIAQGAAVLRRWEELIEAAPADRQELILQELRHSDALCLAAEGIASVDGPHRQALKDLADSRDSLSTDALAAAAPAQETCIAGLLLKLVARASTVHKAALAKLLAAFAQAYEEMDERSRATTQEEKFDDSRQDSPEQTLLWLRCLLQAALTDWQHQDLLQKAAVARAARRALEGIWDSGVVSLDVGCEVWAARPPHGRWCRGRVRTIGPDAVEVEWLRPGSAPTAQSTSQLVTGEAYPQEGASQADAAASIPSSKIVPVPRPVAALRAPQCSEAEMVSTSFEEEFTLLDSCAARAEELRSLLGEFRSRCVNAVANDNLITSACPGHASKDLQALRRERERHLQLVQDEAGKSQVKLQGCQAQVLESSQAFRRELAGLQEKREEHYVRLQKLQDERQKLIEQLTAVDQSLADLGSSLDDLDINEKRLQENMKHVSEEMCDWMATEGTRQEQLVGEQGLLAGIAALAQSIESEVGAQAAASENAEQDCEDVPAVGSALATACVLAEYQRLRALERILAKSRPQGDKGSDWSAAKQAVHRAIAVALESETTVAKLAEDLLAKEGTMERVAEDTVLHQEALSLAGRFYEVEASLRERLKQLRAEHDALIGIPLDDDDDTIADELE
eukprot:TRINITY_DN31581_c0_g1_i1.p1 TRINITY_DN31581_c0_g1~~TRINITY_DN31581_c0_g1_i1.p1  ORF type:complete len:717 (-),score=208.19 TRINITY_DN31581_c0_g1_i1:58-2208(-)